MDEDYYPTTDVLPVTSSRYILGGQEKTGMNQHPTLFAMMCVAGGLRSPVQNP